MYINEIAKYYTFLHLFPNQSQKYISKAKMERRQLKHSRLQRILDL